ncbi:24.9 kDa protein in picA locus [Pelagimonas phthalicica]|uniref:24.9 kDa protein in picA locus n=1 Tax=Pelagimonas phthalicica TaxID=1037362 RepID=A0A238JIP3_9RHOB|nr:glycoside hydrolase family 88 protein [Pelagimonas phthalicica]TDS90085.1 unsaturated rhamnogalacturonyl hydrolase [Pelagimonas phthalicica]SMX30253.1 24.9 kDa protein in picA locus [Pelagimonas phthalicica]
MLTDFFKPYVDQYQPYKGKRWCYEDGCIYRGLTLLAQATGDQTWMDLMIERISRQVEEGGTALTGYNPSDYNIDNILPGRSAFTAHAVTGDAKYLEACHLLMRQLRTHPRTKSGVFWHKLRYPWQIWLDGLYMGQPFQIEYGQKTGDTALVDDSLTQLDTALTQLFAPDTGLYHHAIDEAKMQPWCNPETGASHAHWSRSLGWLVMALVDVAELVGPEKFAPLRARSVKLLQDIMSYRGEEGLWLQVLDRPDLEGNYVETSASAMFVYAFYRAKDLGLFDGDVADLMPALEAYAMQPDETGALHMVEMCEVAGLGWFEGRFRDGSADYYLSENRVADDAKGVGPMMKAYAASLLHAQNTGR